MKAYNMKCRSFFVKISFKLKNIICFVNNKIKNFVDFYLY